MQERRLIQRSRTYLGGQIVFYRRRCTIDCVVRNMSQNGARIVFPSTAGVPGEFDITIRHKGESRRARIVWRNETEAGIEFAGLESSAVVSIESARRIRKLEADKETLSRRVAQLSEPA
jgi:hypothetical protein